MFTIIRETIEGPQEIFDRFIVGKNNLAIVRNNVRRIVQNLRDQDPDSFYRIEASGAAK